MGDWSTLDDVRTRLRKRWDRGEFLTAWASGAPFQTISIPLTGPTNAQLAERFDAVREWIARWREVRRTQPVLVRSRSAGHRTVGANELPTHLEVAGYDALWSLLGVTGRVRLFDELRAETRESQPLLEAWMARHPMRVLDNAGDWARLVRCSAWMAQRPADGTTYLREVPVPGVDTKFIEGNRTILASLLDELVPDRANRAHTPLRFAERYGFAVKPFVVRMRSLDPTRPLLPGVTDLAVRAEEFGAAAPDVATAFIVENDITFLAFPDVPDAIAIFGRGFAVSSVAAMPWLQAQHVVYWGDIDTHGFVALDRLRAVVPHTRSMLMDQATLMAHRDRWVREERPATADLTHLTAEESALYQSLRANDYGDRVRLEQERIHYPAIELAIELASW